MDSEALPCPKGFDCAFYNSCPAFNLTCPPGYFCSSYEGFPHQGEIDYRYAQLREFYSDVDVTQSNKEYYIDQDRTIQSRCVLGFYCYSGSTMSICPSDHWCSEATVDPFECSDLSVCTTAYSIDMTNLLIALLLIVLFLVTSVYLRSKQQRMDKRSRALLNTIQHVENDAKVSQSASTTTNCELTQSIDIDFHNLTFSVQDGQKVYHDVLPGISGHIPGAKFSLMLGSTGCGKTSWLRMLRNGGQRCRVGEVSFWLHRSGSSSATRHSDLHTNDEEEVGEIHSMLLPQSSSPSAVRIAPVDLTEYVGYVPQEDILDRELTIREQLVYNALARRSAASMVAYEEAHKIVVKVLRSLDILHIADAIIGGGENIAANISGGQLKRVNIACELVALSSPAVLLLDEPTAGLDASVAYDLILALKALCSTGITIVAVLQQPRPEIYECMDHLFLMGHDGSIVYEGVPSKAASYLEALGHVKYNENTSDADFCIDVLNDMRDRSTTVGEDPRHVVPPVESVEIERKKRSFVHSNVLGSTGKLNTLMRYAKLTYLNAERLVLIRLRNFLQLVVNITIHVIMAAALSSGFSIIMTDSYLGVLDPPVSSILRSFYPSVLAKYGDSNVSDLALNQLLFFMAGALGCAASLASVPVFAGQSMLAYREQNAGLPVVCFATGRIVGDIMFTLLNGIVFAGAWCAFGMPGEYSQWLSVIIATSFAASGIGYLVSVLTSRNQASVNAVIATFVCCVFSGTEPALRQVNHYPYISWPWYVSFGTWTAEATYVAWADYLADQGAVQDTVQSGADVYGYQVSDGLMRPIGALVGIGLLLRLLTVLSMWLMVAKEE